MANVRPFRGIRPAPEHAAAVAAPPYDVVDDAEARTLLAAQPRTFLRVTRPEITMDGPVPPTGDPRLFAQAKANLQAMLDAGEMIRDDRPCYYLYEETMGQHVQTGLMAAASLAEVEAGTIKRHEHTRQRELDDRTRHIDGVGANTGLIFLTYRARAEIDQQIEAIKSAGAPVYDFVADDDVRHRLWVVEDASSVDALGHAFEALPALYIADGHHRTAASLAVRELRNRKLEAPSLEAPHDYFLAVLIPDDQIQILAYNRVVFDLGGLSKDAFLRSVAVNFSVQADRPAVPERENCYGMYLDGLWYRLEARPGSYPADDRQRSLDAAVLQENLIGPILGIENLRKDPRIAFVGGVRGPEELERQAGHEGVAFYLHPATMQQVMEVADAGGVMPPKSTWVEPKLRSGLLVHSIDD